MLIAITGGIGSGKSVVSQILRTLGYPVYDCDRQAKQIMDCDHNIHANLCGQIHPQAVVDGKINRKLISDLVFTDAAALATLNSIVHTAVTTDLHNWSVRQSSQGHTIQFVETAIPVSSGLYKHVDALWQVIADESLRILRVQKRSGLTEVQVRARMQSQSGEQLGEIPHNDILNNTYTALLPRIHQLLDVIIADKNIK